MAAARKLELYPIDQNEDTKVRVVKKRVRRKRKRLPETVLICAVAAIVIIGCCLYLGQQLHTMRLSATITSLERDIQTMQQEQDHLLIALNQARRLSTVEAIARYELGMVDPVQATIVATDVPDTYQILAGGWTDSEEGQDNIFEAVAEWINRWLPLGGVEAGRIRR